MGKRLRPFALYWLATSAVWIGLLIVQSRLAPLLGVLAFGAQAAVLVVTARVIEMVRDRGAVLSILVAGCVLLGLAVIALFAVVGGDGAFLAFVLLTLYLAGALFFAWGWPAELVLLGSTVAPWLLAIPHLRFPVPALQLGAAIVVGSALSLAAAEARARDVLGNIAHRAREAESRQALETALHEQRAVAAREHAARLAAERATRAKDDFLAVLSHELRSPLNAVLAWTQMLKMGFLDGDKARRAIDTIERNARAQLHLIADLLDTSRIVAGKLNLDDGSVDVGAAVDTVVDAHRDEARIKGLALDLRRESEAAVVRGDAIRLRQVIDNLVTNAIKFTPAGGRVEVVVGRSGTHAEIVVRDTGLGIPATMLPHVFDRFCQADSSTTRRHGGLGLGLAIARSLVELHDGTIDVVSPGTNQGSAFTVRLPLAPACSGASAASGPTRRSASEPLPRLARVRVLVVDDQAQDREVVATMLEHCGADVTAAGSVGEALRCFAMQRPDVVVTDLAMPDEDGFALIRRLRTDGQARVPAIALTALASADDRRRVRAAGFDHYLTKPVEPSELVHAVIDVLAPGA